MAKSYVGAPPGELAPPPRGNPGSATANNLNIHVDIFPREAFTALPKFSLQRKNNTNRQNECKAKVFPDNFPCKIYLYNQVAFYYMYILIHVGGVIIY